MHTVLSVTRCDCALLDAGFTAGWLRGMKQGPVAGDSTSTPWKEIMCSGPVWAIIVGHFCNNWGFYNLLTCLPSYLNNVLRYDIKHAGFIAGLPYVCMAICGNVWAPIVDRCRKKNPSSTGTHSVRMLHCFASSAFPRLDTWLPSPQTQGFGERFRNLQGT